MSHTRVLNAFVLKNISPTAKKSILDIGCGLGWWGCVIRGKKKEIEYLVGLDIHKPYLYAAKGRHLYDDLVLCDASKLAFKTDSFNIVLASEVIEHLHKRRGMELLTEIERICKDKSIITTPNGYFPIKGSTKSDIHRSQWFVKDFRSRRMVVRGLGSKLVKSCWKHEYLWIFLSMPFTPLSYLFPHMAGLLVVTKDMKRKRFRNYKQKAKNGVCALDYSATYNQLKYQFHTSATF